MARKKKEEEIIEADVVETTLEDILADRFSRYSKYIIQERALPDARDGLKPVQRRILWAMYEDGNTYNHPYRKSAKTVGNVIGNYHPHGDSSVYDALVRMSQDWKMSIPLVDMQGNNGSIDDDPAAAMRYTEARLSKISSTMLEDIDKDTTEWAPNFSDDKMEPTVLPARYPSLLVNGITGIAAGYATNIPPHNLKEVIQASLYRLDHPDCSLDELMQFVKGPDFPTGGIAMSLEGIRDAFETGKGKVIVRAKTEIADLKTIQQIIVTEIPYEVVKGNLVKRIDELRLNKKVDGMLDVRDESDRNGLRIAIDLKKEANAEAILNFLYKNTDLQVSYHYNMVAIVSKAPKQLGLAPILDAFLAHREDVVIRRSRYTLAQKEKRAHIVDGLIRAVSVLDEIIAIIRKSKNKSDSKKNLIERFGFSEAQAEAIVTLQLYRLSNTDILELQKESAALEKEMKFLRGILESKAKRHKLMAKELQEIADEFGQERRTVIESSVQELVIDPLAMIADEQVMVSVSRDGYIKKSSLRSYSSSQQTLPGMKEDDTLVGMVQASTLENVLFFTNKGKYGVVPVYKLEEARWKDVGGPVSSQIKTDPGEKIIGVWLFDKMPEHIQFVLCSKKGSIKRLASADLPKGRGNRAVPVMKLGSEDEMLSVCASLSDQDEVILTSRDGYGYRLNLKQIPASSAKSKGVNGMKLGSGDEIASAILTDENYVAVMSDTHQVKRMACADIACLNRPAKGNLLFKKVKSAPMQIESVVPVSMSEPNKYVAADVSEIKGSDIPKMTPAQTFSSAMADSGFVQWLPTVNRLQEGDWPDVHEDEAETSVEQISLFGEGE